MDNIQKIIDKIDFALISFNERIAVSKKQGLQNDGYLISFEMGLNEIKNKLQKREKINSTIKQKWNNHIGNNHRFFEGDPLEIILNDIDYMLNDYPLIEKTFFDKIMRFLD